MRINTKYKKGSFTVEAACVMSLVLLVIIGTIYLFFFVHNRAWLTAAAYEAALSGSMEENKENGQVYETAAMRADELAGQGFFGIADLKKEVKTGKETEVSFSADTFSVFGGFQWKLQAQGQSKIIRPTEWIRKVKSAAELIK